MSNATESPGKAGGLPKGNYAKGVLWLLFENRALQLCTDAVIEVL